MVIDSDLTLGEVFNVGNDEEITIEALALEIIKQTGSTSVIEKIEYEEAYATGFEDMQRRIPDITKIKRVLGWTPKRSLDVIIKEIADHLNDHHLNTQHPM
jgi:UDP-glucose 4-epimerase